MAWSGHDSRDSLFAVLARIWKLVAQSLPVWKFKKIGKSRSTSAAKRLLTVKSMLPKTSIEGKCLSTKDEGEQDLIDFLDWLDWFFVDKNTYLSEPSIDINYFGGCIENITTMRSENIPEMQRSGLQITITIEKCMMIRRDLLLLGSIWRWCLTPYTRLQTRDEMHLQQHWSSRIG